MPATGGRRGRRDNGLVASSYAAAGDVDPRIGEHLLDVLAGDGIAAYLQPSTDLHPVTRTTSLPARPTDRLFVDRQHLDAARDYLHRVAAGPERTAADEPDPEPVDHERAAGNDRATADEGALDAAWREIVAGYHISVDPTDAPWPESEEVRLTEPRPLPQIDPSTEVPRRRRTDLAKPSDEAEPGAPHEPSLLDALDTFGATLPDEDDDEGYTPPPAPPLPRISAAAGMAVAAIVFGLTLFVWPGLLPMDPDTVLLVAFGSIVAGFGALIWRLRPGDDEEEDPDDGARV